MPSRTVADVGRSGQRAADRDRVATRSPKSSRGFGEKGVSAEKVASDACDEAEAYLAADVPVGTHLADQLLIPMALAGGGTFRTVTPTAHTMTNADVIRRFLDVSIAVEHEGNGIYRVSVGSAVEGTGVMKTRDLVKMGIPAGRCADAAKRILQDADAAKRNMADRPGRPGPRRRVSRRVSRGPGICGARAAPARSRRGRGPLRSEGRRCALPDLGRRTSSATAAAADEERLQAAGGGGRRAHAGRARRLRAADRRRAGDGGRRHPVRGRRRHRVPDEDDGAGPAGQRARRTIRRG